jgi:hypothetical protein
LVADLGRGQDHGGESVVDGAWACHLAHEV